MRQARTWLAGPSRRFWGHRGDVARRRGAAGALWGLFTPNRRRNLSPSIPALLLNQKRHYLLFLPRTGPAAQPALLAAVPRAQKPREIPSALVTWLGPGFHLPLAAHPKLGHNPPLPCTHTSVHRQGCEFVCESVCGRVDGKVAEVRMYSCPQVCTSEHKHLHTPVPTSHLCKHTCPAHTHRPCCSGGAGRFGGAYSCAGTHGDQGVQAAWRGTDRFGGYSSSRGCSTCGVQAVWGGMLEIREI